MESETRRSRRPPSSSSEKRRKPLSDSTNVVVPTSTVLRNLTSSLSTPPPFPNPKPKPKLNPNQNSKPYDSSNAKQDTNSSKSDTSIGSSNYNHVARNPNASTPPRVSVTHPGDGREEVFEPTVVYSRRQTADKIKEKGTYSFLQKKKDKENADTVPFTCPPLQKTTDKGKATAVPFKSSLVDKRRDKGKAVAVPPSFPLEKTTDNGKAVSVPISCPSLANTRNKRKATTVPFSCPPLPKTRKIRNEVKEAEDARLSKSCAGPRPKNQKKRCVLPEEDFNNDLQQKFIELQRAYFKDVDEFELPEEEISESELDNEDAKKIFNQDS